MTLKQYDNINWELLNIVPSTSTNVLELGCSGGKMGEAFKNAHPGAKWTGVDVSSQALSSAIKRIDEVSLMDLNDPRAEHLPGDNYDTVVMGDVLEHLSDPIKAMDFIYKVSSPEAHALCCMPIMTNIGIIERMLIGDLSYDEYGLLDSTHLRFMSVASTIKLFLDSGWFPTIVGTRYVGIGGGGARDANFTEMLIQAAAIRGIPRSTAERNLHSFQIWLDGYKSPTAEKKTTTPFSVVVPVNNTTLYNINAGRSPGLKEVGAEIIPIVGASSAADAFEEGCKKASHRWILFCHQDVYVPEGAGYMLSSLFESQHNAANSLVGFIGTSDTGTNGMVIDRVNTIDFPRTSQATSLDEFAVAMTKDTQHKIDPALGWHLWATDLCMMAQHRNAEASIERVPLFHNSLTENGATDSFNSSLAILKEKHKGYGSITTLTGTFDL